MPPSAPVPPAPPNQAAPVGPYSPFKNTPVPGRPDLVGLGQAQGGAWQGASGGSVAKPVDARGPGGYRGQGPDQADYDSVQGYADQAHDAARRYLDPQQAQQNRRMEQTLINKGVDPGSEQGQEMMMQLSRQQNDANAAAAYQGLQFGQGIQNQMFGQANANNQNALAARGQDVQRYGAELGHNAQLANLDNQRYATDMGYQNSLNQAKANMYGQDLQYNLGQGTLDMGRQGQDFNQMMQMMGFDRAGQQYNDQLMMSLLGFDKPGNAYQYDPTGAYGSSLGASAGDKGIFGGLL